MNHEETFRESWSGVLRGDIETVRAGDGVDGALCR